MKSVKKILEGLTGFGDGPVMIVPFTVYAEVVNELGDRAEILEDAEGVALYDQGLKYLILPLATENPKPEAPKAQVKKVVKEEPSSDEGV